MKDKLIKVIPEIETRKQNQQIYENLLELNNANIQSERTNKELPSTTKAHHREISDQWGKTQNPKRFKRQKQIMYTESRQNVIRLLNNTNENQKSMEHRRKLTESYFPISKLTTKLH